MGYIDGGGKLPSSVGLLVGSIGGGRVGSHGQYPDMNRFKWWSILVWCSCLVWFSMFYRSYDESDETAGKNKVVILSIMVIFSLIAIGGLLTSIIKCFEKKRQDRVEGVFIFLSLIVWVVYALVIICGYKGVVGLESVDDYIAKNPTSYFFAFGSLFTAVYLTASWFKECILGDETSLTTTQWIFLATAGILVLASASRSFIEDKCIQSATKNGCPDIIYAIFIGAMSGIMSIVLTPWRSAPLKCQAEIAMILFFTWALAIGLLTFDDGPAVHINTMYFGTYFSFFLSLNIMTTANYADSILESMPHQHVEFANANSVTRNLRGAAGFLDMAYANLTSSQDAEMDDDPRARDEAQAMIFESVGGSMSSIMNDRNESPTSLNESRMFKQKVLVGRRQLSRIEVWFLLMIESIICVIVLIEKTNSNQSIYEQWIIVVPFLSIFISIVGWCISSVQRKKWAYVVEGILIISLIILWIRCLLAVTMYFTKYPDANGNTFSGMTGNQLFMTYGTFFTVLFIFTKFCNASVTTTDWLLISATTAIIFMVVAIEYGEDPNLKHGQFFKCGKNSENITCKNIKYTQFIGAGSAALSFAMFLISFCPAGRPLAFLHVIVGTFLLLAWCVTLFYIVFQADGVGAKIGPIFFACWATLFFCVDVTTTNLLLLCSNQTSSEDVEDENSFQNENIDED